MIVEDNRKDAELIEITLRRMGIGTIVREQDGESAWINFTNRENEPFDLIVADLKLPGMSGLDLLEEVRETGSHVPFVVFTGLISLQAVQEAKALGVTSYIPKPCPPSKLQEKIESALRADDDLDFRS